MASEARGTALHCACRIGSVPVCQLLLMFNADFNIKDGSGKLPIEVTEDSAIVKLISKYAEHVERTSPIVPEGGVIKEEDEEDEEDNDEKPTSFQNGENKSSNGAASDAGQPQV